MQKLDLIVTIKHGSHLYGTNTEKSDVDYKGIYMPTHKEVVLGKYKDTYDLGTNKSSQKNTADDIDHTVYAFPKFVDMLKKGDMVALDMLFDTNPHYLNTVVFGYVNPFARLQKNKHLFLSKNLGGYLGYVRKQASKYGIKGTRMSSLKGVLDYLNYLENLVDSDNLIVMRLENFINALPTDNHCFPDGNFYNVLGAKHQLTVPFFEFKRIIQKKYDEYGHRAQKAMEDNGVDWKSLHHAVRASFQLLDILQGKDVVFPFTGHRLKVLMDIKNGDMSFDQVKDYLEILGDRVIEAQATSTLPESIDVEAIDDLTYHIMSEHWV